MSCGCHAAKQQCPEAAWSPVPPALPQNPDLGPRCLQPLVQSSSQAFRQLRPHCPSPLPPAPQCPVCGCFKGKSGFDVAREGRETL